MWVHRHTSREPGALGSNLSLPVFDFCDLGILSHFAVRSFTCHCGGGRRWRIGSQELQWALWCLAMGWSSIFHFLDQPLSSPHLTHPLQLLLKLCKEFYFLSRGSTQPSCRWVVWLLVTGLRSGKLRSVNSFLRRVAAGTHQISREGDLCATGGEVSQVAVGLKGYWLHWRLPVASTDLHRDRHTQLLSLL